MLIPLSEEKIKEVFRSQDTVEDALLGLFKEYTPDWDKIESVNHFPQITRYTAEKIIGCFSEVGEEKNWDKGKISIFWMNYGWGCLTSEGLKDWELFLDEEKIIYI